jgi:hypothetical protein
MVNKELLKEMMDKNYVMVQKHPDAELYIYNYTRSANFEKVWNEVTLLTRGLILDAEYNIVARPFVKFFNIEQHAPEEIPVLPFEAYEKMDGSLGILYWLDDKPYIASRGSFDSDQARHANEVLYSKYTHTFDKITKGVTYLFEIIYPSNRIVVDYGDKDDLVLLAMIDNATGLDIELHDIGFELVKRYDGVNDVHRLRDVQEDNREGFIVKFTNGFRVKLKFEEYCRLHSIVTNVSNVVVWEYLKDGKPLDELIDRTPDEFDAFVIKTVNELKDNFKKIEDRHYETYQDLIFDNPTRKEYAERVLSLSGYNTKVLFNMFGNRYYSDAIWTMVRPKWCRPFIKNADEEL